MSKLALKLRDQNRRKTVKKFAAKRTELMSLINDQKLSPEDRYEARLKLRGRGIEHAQASGAEEPNSLVLVRALQVGDGLAGAIAAEGAGWRVEWKDFDGAK